jgi:hypothetical protein
MEREIVVRGTGGAPALSDLPGLVAATSSATRLPGAADGTVRSAVGGSGAEPSELGEDLTPSEVTVDAAVEVRFSII